MASRGFIRGGREVAGFWIIILGLCILAGALSYGLGRDWVGRTLGEAISNENVQIKPQEQASGAAAGNQEQTGPPPAQAKADLEPREPTEAEKQELAAQNLGDTGGNAEAAGGAEPPPSEVPSASAGAGAAGGSYEVTAGSFTVVANAERVERDLEKRGHHPRLVQIQRRGTTYHRVVVGTYSDKQEAETVKQDLEAAGFVVGLSGG